MEMHKIYIAWFLWGFWSKIALIVASLVSYVISFSAKNAATVLGAVALGLYITNGFVWLAFGAIWRFSDPGMVAAGEKLTKRTG